MKKIQGKVWRFGDGIDTDIIIPASRLVLPLEEMKAYAMAPVMPEFASQVMPGDLIVAGKNFGCGSSREQAPAVLKALGINAIVASGFARIFFRNAINLGLPVIECDGIQAYVGQGDRVEIDPAKGEIFLLKTGRVFSGSRLPDFLLEIVAAGGLVPHRRQQAVFQWGSSFPR